MIRSFLTCILILPGSFLKAQTDSTLSKNLPAGPYTVLSTEILPYLDYSNGSSARICVEHAWDKKLSVYAGGGLYFERGYVVRAGVKRFFGEDDEGRYFLGLEYMYMWHIHRVDDYYRKTNARGNYDPDESRPFSFTGEKNNHLIDIMVGYDMFWRYGLTVQWRAGEG